MFTWQVSIYIKQYIQKIMTFLQSGELHPSVKFEDTLAVSLEWRNGKNLGTKMSGYITRHG